jgi:hypothetical protein
MPGKGKMQCEGDRRVRIHEDAQAGEVQGCALGAGIDRKPETER